MDLTPFLKNLGKKDDEPEVELTEEEIIAARREYHRLHAPKRGPQKVRWLTAGQQRRAQERWTRTRARKANRSYRRQWMANEARFQTLLAQIRLIDKTPDSALVPGVVRVLEQNYGSVEDAREHLTALVQERVANAQRQAS